MQYEFLIPNHRPFRIKTLYAGLMQSLFYLNKTRIHVICNLSTAHEGFADGQKIFVTNHGTQILVKEVQEMKTLKLYLDRKLMKKQQRESKKFFAEIMKANKSILEGRTKL